MKKFIAFFILVLSSVQIFAKSDYFDSLTFINTFGGDKDCMLEDLVELQKSGSDFIPSIYINDRFQMDYKSKKINSRVRFDGAFLCFDRSNLASTENGFEFRPRGYVSYKPFSFLEMGIGNYCFSKYAATGGELFALDDVPCGAKLVEGGIYFGSSYKGFSAFASLNNSSETFETLSAEYRVGAEYKLKNKFSVSANVFNQQDKIGYGVFTSLDFVPELNLNFGVVYGDSEEYFYKDLYATVTPRFDFSSKYEIKKCGIVFAVDYLQELIEHSSNKGLPFFVAGRFDWNFLTCNYLDLNFSYSGFYGENPKYKIQSGLNYSLETLVGTFGTGFHISANHNGIKKIGIPFTYKYKFTVENKDKKNGN